jgi:hypothetical protein
MKRLLLMFLLFTVLHTTAAAQGAMPADTLIIHEGSRAFTEGTFENTSLHGSTVRLTTPGGYSEGTYTSPVVEIPRPAARVVPSWNIFCNQNEGWRIEVQVKNADGELSPWFYLGSDGTSAFRGEKMVKCPWGKVAVDNIILEKPATAVQYRVLLRGIRNSPSLRLFALAFRHAPPAADDIPDPGLLTRSKPIVIPCRTQYAEAQEIASRICCPTSTSMVLEYLGLRIPTAEVAARLFYREHDIYGTWWAPPQFACQLGFKGWVRLFSCWKDVQETLAQGQPLIASIAFGKGELTNAPISATTGHVVLVTGFDPAGRVLVNDPANKKPENGPVVYDSREFAKAWFGHGGVAIVIRK